MRLSGTSSSSSLLRQQAEYCGTTFCSSFLTACCHNAGDKTRPIPPPHAAAHPQMTKPFSQCSLPDLAFEISLSARAAASLLLPRLADKKQVTAVLQRHPRVRGASGLVCTGTAENKRAWFSMLRDLFSASGAAAALVSDAALLRVYLVCKDCFRRGRVRISDAAADGPVGGAVADISGAARAAQAKAQPPLHHV